MRRTDVTWVGDKATGGCIFRRPGVSRNWYTAISQYGLEKIQTTKTGDQSQALNILRDRLRQADQGQDVQAKNDKITVAKLFTLSLEQFQAQGFRSPHYLTTAHAAMVPIIGHIPVRQLDAVAIAKMVRDLSRRPGKSGGSMIAPATICSYLAALSRALRIAKENLIISLIPKIRRPKFNNTRTEFWSEQQVEEVAARLSAPLAGVLRMGYATGMRRGEILQLRWRDVDEAGRRLRVYRTKNNAVKSLPLSDSVLAIIQAQREAQKQQGIVAMYVFSADGGPLNGKSVSRTISRAALAAGHPLRLHDTRRSAARDMVRAGVSEGVAMQITGHKTRSIFERYNIGTDSDREQAVNLLEKYRQDKKGQSRDKKVVTI